MEIFNPRMLILRGVLSIIFGILAFVWPGPVLLTIALMYGAYAFMDGVLAISAAIWRERYHRFWSLPVFEGIVGIGIGVVTLIWPDITVLALSLYVGFWAIITGLLEVSAAFELGRAAFQFSKAGRVFLGLAGAASVILGGMILMTPSIGALTLLILVGGYAFVFGFLILSLGLRLRSRVRIVSSSEEEIPMKKAA